MKVYKYLALVTLFSVFSVAHAVEAGSDLTLEHAVSVAIKNDPWLTGSMHSQQALESEAIASASLPNPKVSIAAANFPADNFSFRQEGMTQVTVGVSQAFPRGDTLILSKRKNELLAQQHPFLRADRIAKVTATVKKLWLEVFNAQKSIHLIERDRDLFEQLVAAAEASYASTVGNTRQQDVIRAQLELTRLDDRLTSLHQRKEEFQRQLSEWIGDLALNPMSASLPDQDLPLLTQSPKHQSGGYEQIKQHPALLAWDQRIKASETSIELARQSYKPEWGVNLKYGYRNEDLAGNDRSDLISGGISFDLPLFTSNRQDQYVSAATNRAEALRTEKLLAARRMLANLERVRVQLSRLDERYALYEQELLPQMASHAEAALSAYNNDDGDFAEAIRSRIAELNAKIEALTIAVERQKIMAEANYLLVSGV